MKPINILKEIEFAFQEVNTKEELVNLKKMIMDKNTILPTIISSMPSFSWSVSPLNPKTKCSNCKIVLEPAVSCLKEYFLYSGFNKEVNIFCRICGKERLKNHVESIVNITQIP